ncbi:MAG: CU044_5270 family protein, partial [Trebonia sp.]
GAAAAVAAGLTLTSPGHRAAPPYTLDGFLTAAASAARAGNAQLPRPDQAYYTKQVSQWTSNGSHHIQGCVLSWNLYPLSGRGVGITDLYRLACSSPQHELPGLARAAARWPSLFQSGYLYPALGALPDEPAALRSALYAASGLGPAHWGMESSYTADEVVFTLAGRLLEAPLSGTLRAAVYQVIAGLPGVTLVRNATDVTGRRGVGIEMTLPSPKGPPSLQGTNGTIELIISPATYQFLGMDTDSAIFQTQWADIGSGLLTRPGS